MPHRKLHPVHLHLSHPQVLKLQKGHPIQVSRHNLNKKSIKLMLHDHNVHKIHHARKNNKGVRLHLNEYELHGSGLKELLQKAGKFYKDHLKKYVAPVLRQGAKEVLNYGVNASKLALPFLSHEIDSVNNKYGDKLVNAVGKVSGAYGLRKHHRMQMHSGLQHSNERLLSIEHPANNPLILTPIGLPTGGNVYHVYHHAGEHYARNHGNGMHRVNKKKVVSIKQKAHRPHKSGGSFLPA